MKIVSLKRLVVGVTTAAAIFSLSAMNAWAQGSMGAAPGQMSQQQRNQAMYKELGLKPAQITKMEALQKKYTDMVMTRMTAMQKKYGQNPSPDQQQKAMVEMRTMGTQIQAQAKKEMATFLTPTQMAKVNAKMAAGARAAGAGAARP